MVGQRRLELPTSPLSGVRSNQLSYRPLFRVKLIHLTASGTSFKQHLFQALPRSLVSLGIFAFEQLCCSIAGGNRQKWWRIAGSNR